MLMNRILQPRAVARLVALAAASFVASCSVTSDPTDQSNELTTSVSLDVSGIAGVQGVIVEVTASTLASPLVFNLEIDDDGWATGIITIPVGSEVTITARILDAQGVETHRGSATIAVEEGENPTLGFTLRPLMGDLPLEIRIGGVAVTVEPTELAMDVGETARLTARVVDEAGDTLDVIPRWATLHPAVASVDPGGDVTALQAGLAQIVATYAGVGAVAEVSVRESAVPDSSRLADWRVADCSADNGLRQESRLYHPGDILRVDMQVGGHGKPWLGYRLGPPAFYQDSALAVPVKIGVSPDGSADTIFGRTLLHTVQDTWLGYPRLTMFARDSIGLLADTAVGPISVLDREGVRPAFRVAPLPGPVADWVMDPEREVLYLARDDSALISVCRFRPADPRDAQETRRDGRVGPRATSPVRGYCCSPGLPGCSK